MRDLLYEIKYAWQRVVRGYDDRIYWDIPGYLDPIIIAGLKKLRDDGMGYPSQFETPDEWKAVLDEMIRGFEIDPDGFTNEGWEQRKKGLELFAQYYEALWD